MSAGVVALVVQNMGRTGPISPASGGTSGAAVLGGALLWALVSVLVATESANRGMRRRAWGWMASFVVSTLVAAYSFWRLV
jgi:hypothetical protein